MHRKVKCKLGWDHKKIKIPGGSKPRVIKSSPFITQIKKLTLGRYSDFSHCYTVI